MLSLGRDGHSLAVLAGMLPPHNHFELAELRDRALIELGVPDLTSEQAVAAYACELLRWMRDQAAGWPDCLAEVRGLGDPQGDWHDLYDFRVLYFARLDAMEYGVQHDWPDAEPGEIDGIIQQRAAEYVRQVEASDWYVEFSRVDRRAAT